jgi:hypothetical protein
MKKPGFIILGILFGLIFLTCLIIKDTEQIVNLNELNHKLFGMGAFICMVFAIVFLIAGINSYIIKK